MLFNEAAANIPSGQATLVMLPFGPIRGPSLGLGLLKGVANQHGYDVGVRYANVRFASKVGVARYESICEGYPSTVDLYGEWLMAHALKPHAQRDIDRYIDEVVIPSKYQMKRGQIRDAAYFEKLRTDIGEVLDCVNALIEEEAQAICQSRPQLVGLTSTFQQNTACIALARRIKELSPETFVVMGGANVEGVMGRRLQAEYPCIDAVVSGEGEQAFLALLRQHCGSGKPSARRLLTIPIQLLDKPQKSATTSLPLDTLPYPDFSEYFAAIATHLPEDFEPRLPFETSRGCWWGELSHCTFCGLNGTSMAFRSKSQRRAFAELNHLVRTYGRYKIDVVDNILDMAYFETFIPQLAEAGEKLGLFYETKANLNKSHLKALADAGIKAIQPGIESLSDDALKTMRKGVKAIHNVQLLKWAKQFGIEPVWNFLWGFPGEDPQEYARISQWIPLLHHLQPPKGGSRLRLDRFSPMFERRDEFGLTHVRPFPAYEQVYGLDNEALFELAYYFDFDYADGRNPTSYTIGLREALLHWQSNFATSELLLQDFDDEALIIDTRTGPGLGGVYVLGALETRLLRCSDKAIADATLLDRVMALEARDATTVSEALERLEARGLILKLSGLCLALPVNLRDYSPEGLALSQVSKAIQKLATPSPEGDALVIARA